MKAQNETDSARICARCNKAEVHKSLFRKSQYYEGNGALCYECQVELISRYWVNAAEEFDQRAPGFLSVARKSYDASDHLTWGPCIVSWHLGLGLDDHFNTESKKTISFEEFLGCYSKTVLEEYFYTYFRSIGAAQWELLGKMFIVYIDQYNNHHAKITVNTIDSLTGLLQKMIAESQDVLSNLEPGFLSNDIWDDVGISMEEVEYEEMLIEEEEEQQEYERTHYSLDTWYQQIKNVTPLKDVFIGEKWEQVDRTMEAIGLASDSWVQAKPSHARTTTVEIEDIIEEFERVRTSLYFAALQYYDDSFMPDEKRLSFEELLNYISAYANKQYEYAQVELSAVNGVLVPWCRIAKEQRDYRQVPAVETLLQLDQGTLVVWQNLDRMLSGSRSPEQFMTKQAGAVRSHLELVYHRYLIGEKGLKKVDMFMNELPLEPQDPFLKKSSTSFQDIEKISIDGQEVLVSAYMLPHVSKLTKTELSALGGSEGISKNQGFYVYRNRRLIVWGTWFRMRRKDELSKLARIQVDIPNSMDHLWTLDIRKSSAIPPEIVRKNLNSVVDRIAAGSKRTWTFRGKKEVGDSVCHFWTKERTREGVSYSLNKDHPLIEQLQENLPIEKRHLLSAYLHAVEANLPLNQLYVDLNNEEKINIRYEKDAEREAMEMAEMLIKCFDGSPQRVSEIGRLLDTDPFCLYKSVTDRLRKEIDYCD